MWDNEAIFDQFIYLYELTSHLKDVYKTNYLTFVLHVVVNGLAFRWRVDCSNLFLLDAVFYTSYMI